MYGNNEQRSKINYRKNFVLKFAYKYIWILDMYNKSEDAVFLNILFLLFSHVTGFNEDKMLLRTWNCCVILNIPQL